MNTPSDKSHGPLGRYVPWATWDEWISTYRYLYSCTESHVTHALHTVDVWRIRGRVPMAVDATATLRRICRLDEGGTLDAQTLRLQYSLAIVRFVNGVTDAAQKGRLAVSVAGLAHQAGVPRLLVDIRHESTHNELPTISVLRVAAGQALEWLQQWYWEAQRAGVVRWRARVCEVVRAYVYSHWLASMKDASRNKIRDADEDVDVDSGVGDRGGGDWGAKRRKKKANRGSDPDGDAANLAEYCPRKEKKNRQTLLNELKGMLAVGGEGMLARGLGGSRVAGLGGAGGAGAEKTCRRVLEQLGDVWPDVAATVLEQRLDALCLACLEQMLGKGEGNGEGEQSMDDACWYRASIAVLHDGTIEHVTEECLRRHCSAFYAAHQAAFIEVRADGEAEAGLMRLRHELGELGDRSCTILQDFLSLFLDVATVDAGRLQRMRACVDDWTRIRETTQKNTSGWSEVDQDSWRPCAIGMMPSTYLSNGSLPDLACCGTNPEKNWTAVVDPAVVIPARLPAPDRCASPSAATGSREQDDTRGTIDTDDDNTFAAGILPPPSFFSPQF